MRSELKSALDTVCALQDQLAQAGVRDEANGRRIVDLEEELTQEEARVGRCDTCVFANSRTMH